MKTYTFVILTLATGLLLRTPAHAQVPQTYDPILEKRSDLRVKFWHNQNAAQNTKPNSAQAQTAGAHEDYSGMVDFMALAAKHSDMRLRAVQIGYPAAYIEWRDRNKPKMVDITNAVPAPKHKGKHPQN